MPKNPITSAKNFVKKHRVAIAVTATTAVAVYLQMQTAKSFNDFLKEHDLFETYYELNEA